MRMKAVLTLGFLAMAGFALAGCGSVTKSGPHSFTGPVTTTVADAKTGATIHCAASNGVRVGAGVPPPGQGVTGNADATSGAATIQLKRRKDGSLVVSCRP
jgi:hypothetical protein